MKTLAIAGTLGLLVMLTSVVLHGQPVSGTLTIAYLGAFVLYKSAGKQARQVHRAAGFVFAGMLTSIIGAWFILPHDLLEVIWHTAPRQVAWHAFVDVFAVLAIALVTIRQLRPGATEPASKRSLDLPWGGALLGVATAGLLTGAIGWLISSDAADTAKLMARKQFGEEFNYFPISIRVKMPPTGATRVHANVCAYKPGTIEMVEVTWSER